MLLEQSAEQSLRVLNSNTLSNAVLVGEDSTTAQLPEGALKSSLSE